MAYASYVLNSIDFLQSRIGNNRPWRSLYCRSEPIPTCTCPCQKKTEEGYDWKMHISASVPPISGYVFGTGFITALMTLK